MDTLWQKREHMRRIFRGEESYGEGTAAEQSNQYRLNVMYEEVVAAALANSVDVERPEVDLLVSLSGFSPETTLLAFELLQPPRLLVISSENTRPKVNVIKEKIGDRLEFSEFQHEYVDPVNPIDMYEQVKKAVRPARSGGPPLRAIIDITGGKKVMSAGAALAASQLDLKMCYIDSDFDPEMRQATPGTERLCILANPTVLFGDKDMDAAQEMFRAGGYSGAKERFGELAESMSEPARARFLGDLAAVYQSWCDLDSTNLPAHARRLRLRIADPRSEVRTETARRLGEQLDFAESLVAKDGSALLLNFYLLGEHYFRLDRHDFAALLFYRTIEKGLAERFRRAYSGFDLSGPRYELLNPDVEGFARDYGTAAMKLFGSNRPIALPWRVQLVEAFILLYLLDDEMLKLTGIKGMPGLGHVRELADIRNHSVLAHGEESVAKEYCAKLRQRALLHLRAFWRLHEDGGDVDERIEILRFVVEA